MKAYFALCLAFNAFLGVLSINAGPAWFLETGDQQERTNPSINARRELQSDNPGSHCGPLTRELVHGVARENTVLVTVMDAIIWKCFGPSYVENIQAANISYWLIAALDPETSMALGAIGVKNCFNAPQNRLAYKGSDTVYKWGGRHWTLTTWNKVHIMRAVYEHGVHIVHSDADVVWFSDPLPYFTRVVTSTPVHITIATDAVQTSNAKGDAGLEISTNPYFNINTGVYFMRQWPGGAEFFALWVSWQNREIGHDQDGFNMITRGQYFRGDTDMPAAHWPRNYETRLFHAALSNTTTVSFLPASMFANTYTYVNARLFEKLSHPLYVVHWVWGGSTMESKRQAMRDALKFHDEPEYYTEPYLLSFELEHLQMPDGYNMWNIKRTEEMIRFHVTAANYQLQQFYYAAAIALITNRTLVMPRFLCYCSKNWYQTQACRINDESATTFPFVCSLNQLLRVKKLTGPGGGLALPGNTQYSGHHVGIREYSFLENPKVPQEVKKSFLEVLPSTLPRPADLRPDQLILTKGDSAKGLGPSITLSAPLNDLELRNVLIPYASVRVIHVPQPGRVLTGFSSPDTAKQFDTEIQKRVTHWCCRSPPEMKARNLTKSVQLVALPTNHYHNLPQLEADFTYLHKTGAVDSDYA